MGFVGDVDQVCHADGFPPGDARHHGMGRGGADGACQFSLQPREDGVAGQRQAGGALFLGQFVEQLARGFAAQNALRQDEKILCVV